MVVAHVPTRALPLPDHGSVFPGFSDSPRFAELPHAAAISTPVINCTSHPCDSARPHVTHPPPNMKTPNLLKTVVLASTLALASFATAQTSVDPYTQRFIDLRAKIMNPANGYFSQDGLPYHSPETLLAEAPDHGHESTSEAFSYWIWLEVMHGRVSGDWAPVNSAWDKIEQFAIPTAALQPTAGDYNPNSPASYAGEFAQPSGYPAMLESGVPVGRDPVSADLTAAYGAKIYGMHWLFDLDNFYGYGNKGDGVSTPSYINTFQRGEQESVYETVPHPSWENFRWGSNDGTGFLRLFVKESTAPAAQWRYTNAPDADARAVQAIYWGAQFAREKGLNPATVLPLAKAAKMGDFLRLSMFDKYFKPLGTQSKTAPGGTGYESAHYLMSWYYAWGGPTVPQNWAFRIGSSHNHFGYQNPVTAYALSNSADLRPPSTNGVRDWTTSLGRQMEFYEWLQSAEGAIAGGATNSWNGRYEAHPAGTAKFYGMAYQANPVYLDPGSNTWFGFQAWSVERVAEYYYLTNDARAKRILDKWIPWARSVVTLTADGSFEIPGTIAWTGQPATWNPAAPAANTNLHISVVNTGKDLGIAACLAKTFIYYAAATQRYGTLDTASRDIAKQLLDRMWNKYQTPRGVGIEESRADFSRFFDQEVFIPAGWSGKMANGDIIQPGVKFIDIRSNYRDDPDFPALQQAYDTGTTFKKTYHRFWAQVDIALANAEYGRFFGSSTPNVPVTGVTVSPATATVATGATTTLTVTVSPTTATNKSVTWNSSAPSFATVNASGVVTGVAAGSSLISATTVDGGFSASSTVTVTATNSLTVSPASLSRPAAAGSGSISVTGNVSWTATDNRSWITVTPASGTGNGTITVNLTAHTGTAARNGTVTVTGGGITRTVSISQAAPGVINTLTVSPTTLSLAATASSGPVSITSNVSWTATDDQTWLSVSPASGSNNGSLTVSATANTGAARSGTVTITGGGLTRTIAVSQATAVTTPCANPQAVALPFSKDGVGEFCYVITGTIKNINSWNMQLVEINGVNVTNNYVAGANLPPKVNGNYYVRYIGNLPWSHFEATKP